MSELITILSIFGAVIGFISLSNDSYKTQLLKLKLINEKRTIFLIGILTILIFILENSLQNYQKTIYTYYTIIVVFFITNYFMKTI